MTSRNIGTLNVSGIRSICRNVIGLFAVNGKNLSPRKEVQFQSKLPVLPFYMFHRKHHPCGVDRSWITSQPTNSTYSNSLQCTNPLTHAGIFRSQSILLNQFRQLIDIAIIYIRTKMLVYNLWHFSVYWTINKADCSNSPEIKFIPKRFVMNYFYYPSTLVEFVTTSLFRLLVATNTWNQQQPNTTAQKHEMAFVS